MQPQGQRVQRSDIDKMLPEVLCTSVTAKYRGGLSPNSLHSA